MAFDHILTRTTTHVIPKSALPSAAYKKYIAK